MVVITLKARPPNPALDAFMADYAAMTEPHPFNPKVRLLRHDGAIVQLELSVFDGKILLGAILTQLDRQREGHGTAIMRRLMAMADHRAVTLRGTAQAFIRKGPKELVTRRLRDWYEKLGFTILSGNARHGYDMQYVGSPKTGDQP